LIDHDDLFGQTLARENRPDRIEQQLRPFA
jgi:hypothetical protein